MKLKIFLLYIIGILFFGNVAVHAQMKSGSITDTTAAVKKYHKSKKYRKFQHKLMKQRKKKAHAEARAQQRAHDDSVRNANKMAKAKDSGKPMTRADSVKARQDRHADSLEAVADYKNSKRFGDSVEIVKRKRTDSIENARNHYRDSVASARKHNMDSTKLVRKHQTDSVKFARKHVTDSIMAVRKKRTDSLAKIKADKEKALKAQDKKSTDKKKLALEIKMKSKREAYTNKSMLKKKWTPFRRVVQNSFTRYNYYFNANRKMEEASANMQRGARKENYDSLIFLYPFDPNKDSTLLAADMDSIIHKVSVGIQIHDPRVKWENDLYLLLGEAYYYKGKYGNAIAAFKYIISSDEVAKKDEPKAPAAKGGGKAQPSIVEEEKGGIGFLQHKSVHNEAILWLARTYTEYKQIENAEAVISLLETDPKLPEDLQGRVAMEKAFAYLADANPISASRQLAIGVEDRNLPSWLRMRCAFLNGQLLQNMGKHKEAAESFERCLDFFPKIEMDFYARKYIASNQLMAGDNVAEAIKPLKKVLNDGKYVTYHDQVYFVMGRLAAKANKNDDAIDYLTKSTQQPKATKKQKALSFAALGDVYYATGDYPMARYSYDSAVKYAGSNSKDSAIVKAQQRGKGLNEITAPWGQIRDIDSLLELASYNDKEQRSAVRKYLRDLEKKIQDSVDNAAENASNTIAVSSDQTSEPSEAANWYFSNPSNMQQGSNDFKRKWGNRPLSDNWRRASGQGLTGAGGANNSGLEETPEQDTRNTNGLPSEESLLAKIPNTPTQKAKCYRDEQKAYIALAKAYVKQLEDYVHAEHALDTLDTRYPDHNQKEEELNLRYQIALHKNDLAQAQTYAAELLKQFPTSAYAKDLKPKTEAEKGPQKVGGKTVSEYYDETYELIQKHQYTEALMRVQTGKKEFDNVAFKKRFMIAEALCYGGMDNYNMADTALASFNKAYPADSLSGWAKEVGDYIKDVRKNGRPSWYNDTAFVSKYKIKKKKVKKPEPEKAPIMAPPPASDIPAMYAYKPEEEHFGLFILNALDSRTARLKQALKDAGSGDSTNVVIDLYSNELVLVLVKNFPRSALAKTYIESVKSKEVFKDFKPEEYEAYVISAKNYKKMLAERNPAPYRSFYNAYYKQN